MLLRRIRVLLLGFAVGVAISGITAFPLSWELSQATRLLGANETSTGLAGWIYTVQKGLLATDARYPFISYGTDWLAFGHLVIAAAFWGPIKDPVRNAFIVRWGMFACLTSIPVALICGPLRGIPPFWQAIDCSFGLIGIVPRIFVDRAIRELEALR